MLSNLLLVLAPVLPFTFPCEDAAGVVAGLGRDVDALLERAHAWLESEDEAAARLAFQRVLELDPANDDAHEGLRHHAYDGRWFETWVALSKYRRAEERRMLEERGVVRWRDEWVAPADLPFRRMGWERGADGSWVNPAVLERFAKEKELAEAGHQQQDLTWVPPGEFDPWRAGKWKCGEEWLDAAEADAYHGTIANAWQVPGEHYVVVSTLPRESVDWVKWYADQTYDDLVRLFGVEPGDVVTAQDLLGAEHDLPTVAVLEDVSQYNAFASGDATQNLPSTETEGLSSLHYAFFADRWFDDLQQARVYRGSGVGFWDRANQGMAAYGQHSIRHAAALSYVEAIDPGLDELSRVLGGEVTFDVRRFWASKSIPRWLRYGAASYCERYFLDRTVDETGDPEWARKWGLSNLKSSGGLRDLDAVFEFDLQLNDPASTQLIHEAGLVVLFVLDGGDKNVAKAHERFKRALRSGEDVPDAARRLEDALRKGEKALRRFAEG